MGAAVILVRTDSGIATMALSNEAQGYLVFMFFVMSYFAVAQAVNCTLVVGVFRSRRDTIRAGTGCWNNVGMFDSFRSGSGIYLSL